MKRLIMVAVGSMFAGGLAMADTSEKHETKDTHNVVTGSDSTESTDTKEMKGKDGSAAKMKTKKTVTHKANGGTKKKTESSESHEPAD